MGSTGSASDGNSMSGTAGAAGEGAPGTGCADYEEWVTLNGDRQNIAVLSEDVSNPVILFVHGGPGICDRHWVRHYQSGLAKDYTLVFWDQRGSGKSYTKAVKQSVPQVEQYIQDAKALVEYLCEKFGQDKIVVAGHSWGTVIGVPLVQRYPQHIAAYISQGQVVNGPENERISYEFCLREAKAAGDEKAIAALEGNGPVEGVYPSAKAMRAQRDCLVRYGGSDYHDRSGLVPSLLIPLVKMEGYKLTDIPKYVAGALYLSGVMWPQVVECDYDASARALGVPVLMTVGRHDYNTPFELAEAWFSSLEVPYKEIVWFDDSAHSPIKEEPEKWGRAVEAFLEKVVQR